MAIPFRIRRAEWVAGIFLLIALGASLAGLFVLMRAQGYFTKKYDYRVSFKESYGISVGGSVEIAGTPVGRIEAVTLNDDNRVEIRFNVGEEFANRIRIDTVASVNTPISIAGVLAGSGLILSIGSPDADIVPPGSFLATEEPRTIMDLLKEITGGETADDLAAIVHNVRILSDDLADREGPVRRLLGDAAEVIAEVNEGEGSVGKILRDEGKLAARLDRIAANMDKASARLDPLVARVGPVLTKVENTVASLEEASRPLPAVTAELPKLAADLKAASADLAKIAKDVGRSTPELRKLFGEADRLLADVDEVINAAKRFYLIRINLEKIPDGPIVDAPAR